MIFHDLIITHQIELGKIKFHTLIVWN